MQDTIDFKKLTQKLPKYPISNYNDTTHSSIKASLNEMEGMLFLMKLSTIKEWLSKYRKTFQLALLCDIRYNQNHLTKKEQNIQKLCMKLSDKMGYKYVLDQCLITIYTN